MKNRHEGNLQLGMNHSTATNRLVKDILFALVVSVGYKCHRCNAELTRDTFSIDHKTPWLYSDNPVQSFFDLSNIAFSHHGCNSKEARRPTKMYFSFEEKQKAHEKQHSARRSKKRKIARELKNLPSPLDGISATNAET